MVDCNLLDMVSEEKDFGSKGSEWVFNCISTIIFFSYFLIGKPHRSKA